VKVRVRSDALLVRHAPFGDADAMVTFFTEERGLLSAVARSARRSARRFPALEPMHLLRVGLEERPGADAMTLVESTIVRPRLGLTGAAIAIWPLPGSCATTFSAAAVEL